MANRVIDPLELRQMVEAGKTYREIAHHFGVTVSGVQQAVERLGLQKQSLSHKRFIPWAVAKVHQQSGPVTSLRNLSKVAQGQQIPMVKLNSALRWATRLFEEDKDIDYDSDIGFYERAAEEPDWHIRMVLTEVRSALQGDSTTE